LLSLAIVSSGENLMSDPKSSSFSKSLLADGPAADRAQELNLYGQFIGDWDTDVVTYTPDDVRHRARARSTLAGFLRAGRFRMCG
jgi:hypothetical protein